MSKRTLLEESIKFVKIRKDVASFFIDLILAMCCKCHVYHHRLACGLNTNTKKESRVRRIQRFFAKTIISKEVIAKIIMSLLKIEGKCDLIMDRTNWKFGKNNINYLVLAVRVAHQTAIPLFWSMIPHSGCSDAKARQELLEAFKNIFGFEKIGSFTADREFVGKEWLDYLCHNAIPFFIRTKDNRLIEWAQAPLKKRKLKDFFMDLDDDQERYLYKIIHQHSLQIAGKKTKEGMVVVISNTQDLKEILNTYKHRWSIETMFKNLKTKGFNIEDSHMVCPQRYHKLLGICAISLAVAFSFGKRLSVPFKKTVNAPLMSILTRGIRHVQECFLDLKLSIASDIKLLYHNILKSVV
jgi:hypothetical protein